MERVLIIEDEQLASDKLQMLIRKIRPSMQIVDVLTTVSDSVKWLSHHEADLIFLDINLADDISFKIFEQIETDIPIIFTTAYDQYAIKAFKQNSLDYVLKPVSEEDLKLSLEKFERYQRRENELNHKLKNLLQQFHSDPQYRHRILINYGGKSKSISIQDIAYIYAYEKGTYLVTHDGHTFLADDTLDELEETVDPQEFYRLNRKYLINIKAIREIHKYSTRRLKVDLVPEPKLEAIVPAEKITTFKKWLNH